MESIGSFLIISHHGAVFPCFVHPLYSWLGSLETTSSPQQQTIAKLKDLCLVRNDYFTKFVQFTLYPSHKLILQTPCTTASECCTAYGHHQMQVLAWIIVILLYALRTVFLAPKKYRASLGSFNFSKYM